MRVGGGGCGGGSTDLFLSNWHVSSDISDNGWFIEQAGFSATLAAHQHLGASGHCVLHQFINAGKLQQQKEATTAPSKDHKTQRNRIGARQRRHGGKKRH